MSLEPQWERISTCPVYIPLILTWSVISDGCITGVFCSKNAATWTLLERSFSQRSVWDRLTRDICTSSSILHSHIWLFLRGPDNRVASAIILRRPLQQTRIQSFHPRVLGKWTLSGRSKGETRRIYPAFLFVSVLVSVRCWGFRLLNTYKATPESRWLLIIGAGYERDLTNSLLLAVNLKHGIYRILCDLHCWLIIYNQPPSGLRMLSPNDSWFSTPR